MVAWRLPESDGARSGSTANRSPDQRLAAVQASLDNRNDSYGEAEPHRIQGVRRFRDRFCEMDSAAGRQRNAGHTGLESKGGEADRETAFTGVKAGVRVESPLGDGPRRKTIDGISKPRMTLCVRFNSANNPARGSSIFPEPCFASGVCSDS